MMRKILIGVGTVLLSVALLFAFLGRSDQAFVVAALWILILFGGLFVERMIGRRARTKLPADPP